MIFETDGWKNVPNILNILKEVETTKYQVAQAVTFLSPNVGGHFSTLWFRGSRFHSLTIPKQKGHVFVELPGGSIKAYDIYNQRVGTNPLLQPKQPGIFFHCWKVTSRRGWWSFAPGPCGPAPALRPAAFVKAYGRCCRKGGGWLVKHPLPSPNGPWFWRVPGMDFYVQKKHTKTRTATGGYEGCRGVLFLKKNVMLFFHLDKTGPFPPEILIWKCPHFKAPRNKELDADINCWGPKVFFSPVFGFFLGGVEKGPLDTSLCRYFLRIAFFCQSHTPLKWKKGVYQKWWCWRTMRSFVGR